MQKSILLIDDDPDDLLFLTEAFEQVGISHTIHTALDGVNALTMLQQLDDLPELIILDLRLPKADGIEVLADIRSKFDVRVMIYSTNPSDEMVEASQKLGALGCVRKGTSYVDSLNFAKRIKEILEYQKV